MSPISRMNFWFLFACIFMLTPCLARRSSNTKYSYTDSFVSRVNQFTADFYEVSSKNQKNNFVSSPISVLMVLAMAACGANGNTRRELIQTLHLPMVSGFRLTNFRRFITNLNTHSNTANVELHLVNKLFINKNFEVEWLFNHVTENIFHSEIENINFKDADNAANEINKWCSTKTKNKITNLLSPDDLEDAQLVMVNAVYFRGLWVHSFDSELVERLFYFSRRNFMNIPMMCAIAQYNYGPIPYLDASYIELPYKATDPRKGFSMFIILPDDINGVDAIGSKMHEINFMQLTAPSEEVNLCMPKFKIETKLDLIPILEKMGIHDMFDDSADFSNINTENDLKVTKVIQKAFINVDEQGSEAAAATGASLNSRAFRTDITIDRPFISAIISKISGTPLFWTRVNDPRSVST